jgi:DNA-binding CsgD family transcriptional regulator
MNNKTIEKDERTAFIENKSYSYGYKFISFALLLDIIYRSFMYNKSSWDLFAIIILSGSIMTFYQHKQKILSKIWLKTVVLTIAIAIVTAIIIVLAKLY